MLRKPAGFGGRTQQEPKVDDARARRVVFVEVWRRAGRSALLWGAVIGASVALSASGYATTFPTLAARTTLARSFEHNPGLAALIGPGRHLDTVAGFTAWRTLLLIGAIGAVWGLLTATRLLRGEEDAGRWEILLAGQTTRRGAATQAILGLALGLAVLWATAAAIVVVDGWSDNVRFTTSSSLYLALALASPAAMFVAVGALASQLASTRRQANALSALVLGVAYLVRMAADSSASLAWLRWASPLGWLEELRPLTGSRPLAFVPIALLTIGAGSAAVALAGERDLGASALPAGDAAPPRTALLGSHIGLTIRLTRSNLVGWVGGLAISGLVFGLVAQSAANAVSGSATIERAIARIGGDQGGAASYLGLTFVMAAALIAFAAAGQIGSTRAEEADGHLDNLLVRPVGRASWLAARLGVAAVLVIAAGAITGVTAWVGAATQNSGMTLGNLAEAGLNITPPALFTLGVGGLAFGLWPRRAPAVVYALVAWSFLIELIAAVVSTNRLLLDSSLLHHIAPAPAAAPDWAAAAWMVGLGVLAAVGGMAAFTRRDLVTA